MYSFRSQKCNLLKQFLQKVDAIFMSINEIAKEWKEECFTQSWGGWGGLQPAPSWLTMTPHNTTTDPPLTHTPTPHPPCFSASVLTV